mmetsp:Transcript_52719/g.94127  ORF Transcript_52719/g.94127 Transcript_52719/m.94127 type:complete len:107 (-) Transcript_52719:385-705(-)
MINTIHIFGVAHPSPKQEHVCVLMISVFLFVPHIMVSPLQLDNDGSRLNDVLEDASKMDEGFVEDFYEASTDTGDDEHSASAFSSDTHAEEASGGWGAPPGDEPGG